jgi:hypothetical protein
VDNTSVALARLADARTPMLARLITAILDGTGIEDVATLRALALREQAALQRLRESN